MVFVPKIERIADSVNKIDINKINNIPTANVFSIASQHHAKPLADLFNFNYNNKITKYTYDEDYLIYIGMFNIEFNHFNRMVDREQNIICVFIGSDLLLLSKYINSSDNFLYNFGVNTINNLNKSNVTVISVFDNLDKDLKNLGIKTHNIWTLTPIKRNKYLEKPKGIGIGIYLPNGIKKANKMFRWDIIKPIIQCLDDEKFYIFSNKDMYRAINLDKFDNCTLVTNFDNWVNMIELNIRIPLHDGYPQSVISLYRNSIPTITCDMSAHYTCDMNYLVETIGKDPGIIIDNIIKIIKNRKEIHNKVNWKEIKKVFRYGYFSIDRLIYDCLTTFEKLEVERSKSDSR